MKIRLINKLSFVPEGVFTFRNIPILDKLFLRSYLKEMYNLGYRIGFFDTIKKIGGIAFYKTGYQAGVKAGLEKLKTIATLIKIKK
jgi:hypothetical protein